MKRVVFISLFVAVIMMSASVAVGQTTVKETRNVSGFTEIGFGIAGNLIVKIGPEFSVALEGDKKYLSEIETVLRNNKLVIRNLNNHFFNNEKANVYITLPELIGLGVSGSGNAQIESAINTKTLGLSVSGSGKLFANDVVSGTLNCSVSGSGDIILKGKGNIEKGDISISGSGSYSGEGISFKSLQAIISGSGNCLVNVTESLKATISGSGNVKYLGTPKVDARVSGSGHVRSK
jgi:hypothetical protein